MVMSGKGGVGKSTVAVNLAMELSLNGNKVGLLDVDIHGPNDHIILGVEDSEIMTDGKKFKPVEIGNLKFMTIAFAIDRKDPVIWRGPLKSKLIDQFIQDTLWGDLDYMIIDFPPGSGDEPLEVLKIYENKVNKTGSENETLFHNIQGAVIVTTAQRVALGDVEKIINFLKKMKIPIIGLWENMSYYTCPNCGARHYLFGKNTDELAKKTNIDVIARIPLIPEIGEKFGAALFLTRSEGDVREEFQKAVNTIMEKLDISS